jgi:hypothetical protein
MMKTSIGINQVGAYITRFLHRFHVVIFVLTIVGGLSVATFMLNRTLGAEAPLSEETSSSFDTKTMERVKQLSKTTTETKPLNLPPGRIDPFTGL